MILTNCNKVELINCGCVPFFSYYVAQTYSMLEVGELISNTCTFSEYVIDWYVNGVLKLTTGKGPEVLDGFDSWDCGFWNGVLGTLRWVLDEEEKDMLDT